MNGDPRGEPRSPTGADRFAAQPLNPDDNAGDVIGGGRPPRRQLPRSLVNGLYVVCGIAALAWVGMMVVERVGDPVATPTPAPTIADDVPAEPSTLNRPIDCEGHGRDLKICADPRQQNAPGRHWVSGAGLRFSYSLPNTPDWENGFGWNRYNGNYVSQGNPYGDQEAEAVIYWTQFGGGSLPCGALLDLPEGSSTVERLAAAVSIAPGTELVSGPSDVTVSGAAAQQVVLIVRDDVGCDPGYFYTWRYVKGGPFWSNTDVGDTIRVWVVPVPFTTLLIVAETKHDASPNLELELQQIVDSIRCEVRRCQDHDPSG